MALGATIVFPYVVVFRVTEEDEILPVLPGEVVPMVVPLIGETDFEPMDFPLEPFPPPPLRLNNRDGEDLEMNGTNMRCPKGIETFIYILISGALQTPHCLCTLPAPELHNSIDALRCTTDIQLHKRKDADIIIVVDGCLICIGIAQPPRLC